VALLSRYLIPFSPTITQTSLLLLLLLLLVAISHHVLLPWLFSVQSSDFDGELFDE